MITRLSALLFILCLGGGAHAADVDEPAPPSEYSHLGLGIHEAVDCATLLASAHGPHARALSTEELTIIVDNLIARTLRAIDTAVRERKDPATPAQIDLMKRPGIERAILPTIDPDVAPGQSWFPAALVSARSHSRLAALRENLSNDRGATLAAFVVTGRESIDTHLKQLLGERETLDSQTLTPVEVSIAQRRILEVVNRPLDGMRQASFVLFALSVGYLLTPADAPTSVHALLWSGTAGASAYAWRKFRQFKRLKTTDGRKFIAQIRRDLSDQKIFLAGPLRPFERDAEEAMHRASDERRMFGHFGDRTFLTDTYLLHLVKVRLGQAVDVDLLRRERTAFTPDASRKQSEALIVNSLAVDRFYFEDELSGEPNWLVVMHYGGSTPDKPSPNHPKKTKPVEDAPVEEWLPGLAGARGN